MTHESQPTTGGRACRVYGVVNKACSSIYETGDTNVRVGYSEKDGLGVVGFAVFGPKHAVTHIQTEPRNGSQSSTG
jgi:hypothetical protein